MRLRLVNPHTGSPLGEFSTQNGGPVQGDQAAQLLMNGRSWRRPAGARVAPRISGLKLDDRQGNPLTPDDGDAYLQALQDYYANSQSVSVYELPDDDTVQEAKRPRGVGPSEPSRPRASQMDPGKATGSRALSDAEHAERVLAGRKSGEKRHARAEAHETAIDKIIRERREARAAKKSAKTRKARTKASKEFAGVRERTAKPLPAPAPAPTVPVGRAAPTEVPDVAPAVRPRRGHVKFDELKDGEHYFVVVNPKEMGKHKDPSQAETGASPEPLLRTRSERAADDMVKKNPGAVKFAHQKGVDPAARARAGAAASRASFTGRRLKAGEAAAPGERVHFRDGGSGTIIEHRRSKRDGHRVLVHDDRTNGFRVIPHSEVRDVKPRSRNRAERDAERRANLEARAVQARGHFDRARAEHAGHTDELAKATSRHDSLVRQRAEAQVKVGMIAKLPKEQRPTGLEGLTHQRRLARNLDRELKYSQKTLDDLKARSPGSQLASARTNLAATARAVKAAGGVAPPDVRAKAAKVKADADKAVADAQARLDKARADVEQGDYATKRTAAIDAEQQAAKALEQAHREHDQVKGTLKGTRGHHRVLAQAAITKAVETVAAREKEHARAQKQAQTAHGDYTRAAGAVAQTGAHLAIAQKARGRVGQGPGTGPRVRPVKKPEDVLARKPGDIVRVGGRMATVVRNYKVGKKHKLLVHLHDTGDHPVVGRARVPGMPGGRWAKVPEYVSAPTSTIAQLQVVGHEGVTHVRSTPTLAERKERLRAARNAAHAERADTLGLHPRDRGRLDAASHARRVDEALRGLGEDVPEISRATAEPAEAPAPPPAPLERRAAAPNIKPGQNVAYLDQPVDVTAPEPETYHDHPAAVNLPDQGLVKVHTGGGNMVDVPYENLHPMHGRPYQGSVRDTQVVVDRRTGETAPLIATPEEAPHPAFEPQTRWLWGTDPPSQLHPRKLRPGDEVGFMTVGGSKHGIVLSHDPKAKQVNVYAEGREQAVDWERVHHVRHGDVAQRLATAQGIQGRGAPAIRGPLVDAISADRSSHQRVVGSDGQPAWLRSPSWEGYQRDRQRGIAHRWPAWADDRPGEQVLKRQSRKPTRNNPSPWADASTLSTKETARDERYRTGGNLNDAQVVRTNRQGELREALTEAAAKHTGAMIALYPPKHLADKLAVDGGEKPEDLHVTLAFLGKADDLKSPEMVKTVARTLAARHPPMTGAMSGHGVFTQGADAPVTYASADLPALPGFRQKLVRVLHATGHTPSGEHGFTPHMTLAYGTPKVNVPATPVTFDTLSAVIGGDRHDYPFAGHLQEAHKLGPGWNPRGTPSFPDWKKAKPGTRVRHVRSGRTGTLRRAVNVDKPARGGNRFAVVQWDHGPTGQHVGPGQGVTGRVVAPAFDLERLTEAWKVRLDDPTRTPLKHWPHSRQLRWQGVHVEKWEHPSGTVAVRSQGVGAIERFAGPLWHVTHHGRPVGVIARRQDSGRLVGSGAAYHAIPYRPSGTLSRNATAHSSVAEAAKALLPLQEAQLVEAWAHHRGRRLKKAGARGHIRVHAVTDGRPGAELAAFHHVDGLVGFLNQGPQGHTPHIAVQIHGPGFGAHGRGLTRREQTDLVRRLGEPTQEGNVGYAVGQVAQAAASTFVPGFSAMPLDSQQHAATLVTHHAGFAIHTFHARNPFRRPRPAVPSVPDTGGFVGE
jgi:2'-5' RNA ligase